MRVLNVKDIINTRKIMSNIDTPTLYTITRLHSTYKDDNVNNLNTEMRM